MCFFHEIPFTVTNFTFQVIVQMQNNLLLEQLWNSALSRMSILLQINQPIKICRENRAAIFGGQMKKKALHSIAHYDRGM